MGNSKTHASLARAAGALFGLLVFLSSSLAISGNAEAQTALADRTDVVKTLSEKHGEKSAALGLASNGGLFELFTSPDGATWTIIITCRTAKAAWWARAVCGSRRPKNLRVSQFSPAARAIFQN
jgi:hypothetical protein